MALAVVNFPKVAVESRLRKDLTDYVVAMATMKSIPLPVGPAAQAKVTIQIDSLEVVNLLCNVEPLLGFELKDSTVKTGGYTSVNEAIAHLMPRIEKAWQKH